MRFLTTAASLAAALVTSGSALAAQLNVQAAGGSPVTYTTKGKFTGPTGITGVSCNQTESAKKATCMGGGFSLTFTGVTAPTGVNIGSGSVTSLGTFLLTGIPDASAGVAKGVVNFQLDILQSAPTTGSGSLVGSIYGSVSTSSMTGAFSSLEWDPNRFVNIGPVTYQFIYDADGYAANRGLNIPINASRGIQAIVTSTVPEPSTYAMLGMGLTGLLAAARRRRNANA